MFTIKVLCDSSENSQNLIASTRLGVLVRDNGADMAAQAVVIASVLHVWIGSLHLELPVASQQISVP